MNCELCKQPVQETFLKKVIGTYVKDGKGKMHLVCHACQKRLGDKLKDEFK
jgi:hypothetical protein